jgi:hypothetical protein
MRSQHTCQLSVEIIHHCNTCVYTSHAFWDFAQVVVFNSCCYKATSFRRLKARVKRTYDQRQITQTSGFFDSTKYKLSIARWIQERYAPYLSTVRSFFCLIYEKNEIPLQIVVLNAPWQWSRRKQQEWSAGLQRSQFEHKSRSEGPRMRFSSRLEIKCWVNSGIKWWIRPTLHHNKWDGDVRDCGVHVAGTV